MHEISVLMEVVKQVEQIAIENSIDRIESIVLEIGELSSVVPMFLENYYPMLIEDKKCLQNSNLVIERIEGVAKCKHCKSIFNVIAHEGYCPNCKGFDKTILSGREFLIKELVVYEN